MRELGQPVRERARTRVLVLVAIVGLLAIAAVAGCSSSSDGQGTSSTPGTAAAAAGSADTGAASDAATQEPVTSGTCLEIGDPGSIQGLTCAWLANADAAICDRMTDKLLDELFSGSVEGCQLAIERVRPPDDKARVSFAAVTVDGDRASLEVDDAPGRSRYAVTFVRRDDAWLMDTISSIGRARAESDGATPAREPDPEAERAIKELALRWYRDVDPAVCDSMTDRMLEFGWEKKGAAGRASCRENIAAADPLVDVKVRRPLVNGDRARVTVVYTLDGDRLLDRLTLVRSGDEWLIDRVALIGFVP